MGTLKNHLEGARFGRIAVTSYAGGGRWNCVCDCGSVFTCRTGNLKQGTKSCGCLQREVTQAMGKKYWAKAAAALVKHGQANKTSEYVTWKSMKQRCRDPNCESFVYYGGRGIRVCRRWVESFEAFFEDMGPKPSPAHTIERNDNDGNYCKSNCRWATRKEQAANKRPRKDHLPSSVPA